MIVSIVIPVLNAAPHLPRLLARLRSQQPCMPDEIILVDSGSTDDTATMAAATPGVRFLPLNEKFTHGGSRNRGAAAACGDIVVLMTQDALPANDDWLANMLAPLANPQVGAVYARQIPRPGTNPMEMFFLEHRFPAGATPVIRRKPAGPLTMEDTFFSNVGAAVRRDLLAQFPYNETLIMSEDQQFAKTILAAGWAIAYQPSAPVIHSHNYSLTGTFRRYFDSVYAFRQIFPDHTFGSSSSVGVSYIRREYAYMLRHAPLWLPYYCLYNTAKALATLAAHHTRRLPRRLVRLMSLNRAFWS